MEFHVLVTTWSAQACWSPDFFLTHWGQEKNGRHFPDDIFKCIFFNEIVWILLKISLKFVPKVQINNVQALVQIMAWHRPGDKPLSGPMMVSLLTHICVTRPQWVNCPEKVPNPPQVLRKLKSSEKIPEKYSLIPQQHWYWLLMRLQSKI